MVNFLIYIKSSNCFILTLKFFSFVFISLGVIFNSEMDTLFGTSFLSHFSLCYEEHKLIVIWSMRLLISDLSTANLIADFFLSFIDCLFYFHLLFLANALINSLASNSETMLANFRRSFSKLRTLTSLWFRS